MPQLTLDLSGKKGLGIRYYGDRPYTASRPNLRYDLADGELAEGFFNPIKEYGYLSPVNATTKALTGTTSYLLTSGIVIPQRIAAHSTDAIFFGDEAEDGTEGQIMNLDTAVDTSLDQAYELPVFGSPDQYSKVEDFVQYMVNGVRKIFWVSKNNTGALYQAMIGIAAVDMSSPDPDWSTNTPVGYGSILKGDARHKFVLADNGFLYLLDGNNVHKIDGGTSGGSSGTIYPRVLTFLGSTTSGGTSTVTRLISAVDIRGKMWIGLHVNPAFDIEISSLSGKTINMDVGVYVWNRASTVATMQDYIPIRGARELKSLHLVDGTPVCFTVSIDGYTQLRMWDGSKFKVMKTLEKNAHPNYDKHSVYETGVGIYWFGANGYIYYYGKIDDEARDYALVKLGDMTTHVSNGQTFSKAGILIAANATETVTSGNEAETLAFYISFTDSGGNHLKKWYPHATETVASNAQTGGQGDVYSKVALIPDLSTVNSVSIRCAPTATGSTTIATIKYYFNQSSTVSITKTVTKDDASKGIIQHQLGKPFIHSVQMEIEWDTSNTMSNDTDFRPYVAIIDYSPTKGFKSD